MIFVGYLERIFRAPLSPFVAIMCVLLDVAMIQNHLCVDMIGTDRAIYSNKI